MNRLWNGLIRPIIESVDAKYIVEVGSDTGINTRNILDYCIDNNARMTAIDPFPKFDIDQYKIEFDDKFEIFEELSLNRLPLLEDYDVVLLDGDHNWYTAYNELKIIEKSFKNKNYPIIFVHDVGWPYARRDLYYNPENIPDCFRQPYKRLGISPCQTGLQKEGGINQGLYNSIYENTPKNGVLTAVEDFIEDSDLDFSFKIINAFFGLGILFCKNDKLEDIVKDCIKNCDLVKILEKDRIGLTITHSESRSRNNLLKRNLDENNRKLNQTIQQLEDLKKLSKELIHQRDLVNEKLGEKEAELNQTIQQLEDLKKLSKELIHQRDLVNEKLGEKEAELNQTTHQLENEIERRARDLRGLKTQLNTLRANFYEIEYHGNKGRTITQRLISKFPSIYILLNRKNKNIKSALININGFWAINKNDLFDIGYYLKNNEDVRVNGMDPLLHYIYHGFNEGRNPSPTFDNDHYLKSHLDVENSDLNPLIHYVLYGIKEGRITTNSEVNRYKGISEVERNKNEKTKKLRSTVKYKMQKFRARIGSKIKQFNLYGVGGKKSKYCVSVIMPTYNRANIIERAIDSVLNQTFTNYELIIVDDGSTDNTENLIKKNYGNYLNGKIKYIKEENSGVAKARNTGLAIAEGEIIAYLDSDNQWLDNYLEKMVSALLDNNKNTAYAAMEVDDKIFRNTKFVRNTKYDRKQLLDSNFIDLNVFVHKKFLYNQLGGFNESLTRLVDWELILRYTRLNEPHFVNEILTKYFLSDDLNHISSTVNLGENRSKVYQFHIDERIEKGLDKLRVGYVLWDFPAFSQTFVMNELKWLVENHYDVKVFYKVRPEKEAVLDFDIEAFQIDDENDLIEKIKRFDINRLHTHFVYPACTLLTYPVAERMEVPFTVSAHAVDIFHYENEGRNKIAEIGQSEFCKRIFVPGKFHYEYLAERDVPEEKLMFLRQATSYDIEVDSKVTSLQFKREFKNVITIARFVEKKGIDTLIDAAKMLEHENLVFKIYGYGPLEKDLREQIRNLNLKNVVIEGIIDGHNALKEAYQEGDIFVAPCRRASNGDMDGVPTVIFEAMAYNIPIITTSVSSIPEFVLDDYCGFIVNPDDPISLADKIRYVKDMDKSELAAILKRAQKQVQEYSSVEETIKTMLNIWENYRIDIFMVTYQKGEYKDLKTIKEILDRIFKYTTLEFDLTLVDNGSDKDFREFILEYAVSHPNIRLIFLKDNLLCGPASNIALEVMKNEFAIYLCSNEGFVLKHDWERKAISYMKNRRNVGIAGNLAYSPSYYDGETYKNQEWFDKFRNQEYMIGKDDVKFKHVQGGIYILRRESYQQCGGFNPLLPQNQMDVEYSYYLQSNGWELGEIAEWISLTTKTIPGVYAYLDENTTFIHPLKLDDINTLDDKASKQCNICNGELIKGICSSCNSDNSERAIYRIIGKTDKTYRSLTCTLFLRRNNLHKIFGDGLFKLANIEYSKRDINEDLEFALGNMESTDVLIINLEFDASNYKNIINLINEKLNKEGLLILQLSNNDSLNNNIKEYFIKREFTVDTVHFASEKLTNNEFLVAERRISDE